MTRTLPPVRHPLPDPAYYPAPWPIQVISLIVAATAATSIALIGVLAIGLVMSP